MIFGTIKDDVTGAATEISIFNSSIKDMKENLSNGQGFFYSIFQGNKLNDNDVQGIRNYVKAIEDGTDKFEAFKANITGCSVAAQKYIKEADKAGKSTEQMKAGLKDAAKAGGGFKGAIVNIGSALANMAVGMAVGVAIDLIISGITYLVKVSANAYNDGIENAKEMTSKLNEIDGQIDDVNNQLTETKKKIKELERIKKPNLFEQEQLDGLIKTNDELERQKKYYEYLRESTLKESDSATRVAAMRNLGLNPTYDESEDFWGALGNFLTANTSLGFNLQNGNTAM